MLNTCKRVIKKGEDSSDARHFTKTTFKTDLLLMWTGRRNETKRKYEVLVQSRLDVSLNWRAVVHHIAGTYHSFGSPLLVNLSVQIFEYVN